MGKFQLSQLHSNIEEQGNEGIMQFQRRVKDLRLHIATRKTQDKIKLIISSNTTFHVAPYKIK